MEEENNNKYLSLEENFPVIFNFFERQLPDTIWEEWRGDLEENIQKKTKDRKYSQWQIKILYFHEILLIFHSAQEMGFLDFRNELGELWERVKRKGDDNTNKATTEEENAREKRVRQFNETSLDESANFIGSLSKNKFQELVVKSSWLVEEEKIEEEKNEKIVNWEKIENWNWEDLL